MICKRVNIYKKNICIGDLNKQIQIDIKSLTAPETNFDYGQSFSGTKTVWAAVQTTNGVEIFDGVNIVGTASHLFYIRYDSDITFANYLEYSNEKYKILETENLNQRNEFLLLKCVLRGNESYEANLQ